MIDEYKFGSIEINGQIYDHDVEVRWTGEVLKWWRAESHVIDAEDIKRAIEAGPELIVIGTGIQGVAEVNDRAKQAVKGKDIELIIDNTEEAVKTFNICLYDSEEEEGEQRRVIGLFHLTC